LKTQPKQLLGTLPLDIALPAYINPVFQSLLMPPLGSWSVWLQFRNQPYKTFSTCNLSFGATVQPGPACWVKSGVGGRWLPINWEGVKEGPNTLS